MSSKKAMKQAKNKILQDLKIIFRQISKIILRRRIFKKVIIILLNQNNFKLKTINQNIIIL